MSQKQRAPRGRGPFAAGPVQWPRHGHRARIADRGTLPRMSAGPLGSSRGRSSGRRLMREHAGPT